MKSINPSKNHILLKMLSLFNTSYQKCLTDFDTAQQPVFQWLFQWGLYANSFPYVYLFAFFYKENDDKLWEYEDVYQPPHVIE